MSNPMISADALRSLLDYDAETGVLTWRCARNSHGGKIAPGSIAGGVHRGSSAFVAQIMVNGKKRHLGRFKTAELAHAAYLSAKAELHPAWVAR